MPRKSSLDTRLLKKIVRRLRQQGFAKTAMKELGFSQSTYHKWRRRGEAEIARREQIIEELGPDAGPDFSDPVSTAEQIYVLGWDFEADEIERPDFARQGYARGVPMGGDLSAAPAGEAPRLHDSRPARSRQREPRPRPDHQGLARRHWRYP